MLFRQQIVRYVDAQGKRCSPATPGASRVVQESRKWYGYVPDPKTGKRKRVPLSANKSLAVRMLGDLLKKSERKQAGQSQPEEDYEDLTLEDHLKAYEEECATRRTGKNKRPPSKEHLDQTMARLRRLLEGFHSASEITLAEIQRRVREKEVGKPLPCPEDILEKDYTYREVGKLLGVHRVTITSWMRAWDLPRSGLKIPRESVLRLLDLARSRQGWSDSTVTIGLFLLRRFTAWLYRRGRLAENPLEELRSQSSGKKRRLRHPLSCQEIARLLQSTQSSTRDYKGLTGEDRHAVYLLSLSTGFRANELSAVCPLHFDLDRTPPVVYLPDDDSKNGKGAEQPLPLACVEYYRAYLQGKPADKPLWPGRQGRIRLGAPMLLPDLKDAGIPYVVFSHKGPSYADFHALRHTFVAQLDRAGVSLKQAMQLARHSDPKLTAAIYGQASLSELGRSVEGILDGLVTPMVTPDCVNQEEKKGTKKRKGKKNTQGDHSA